ncbi:hypothetical protein [uncultured Herbaspirillum sp.]|uniref:hypothetical protein n=1 Tax=uncultured Herbaspirillum sp. TaxID=160236 RepID=UPI00258CE67C|nr:hypothetical protein [uncultured Herbaspirillum sp.]
MAKREKFSAPIECKKCGKTGRATWEENENPVYGNGAARELIDVSEGFRRGGAKDSAGDPEIICAKCGVPA